MIQRIQSIFLLLACILLSLVFVFPFFKGNQTTSGFFADSQYTIQDHPALLGVTIGAALVALIAIFVYKNRSLQQKLVYLAILLSIVLLAVVMILGFGDTPDLMNQASIFVGSVLPILAVIFLGISLRGIRKDERIVKSMDRLR